MSTNPVWFEDPEFWQWTREFMFTPERWEAAANSVEDIEQLLRTVPPAKVLDLCCGPGRFTMPLAQAGFEVTAVDRTEILLDELEHRRAEVGLDFEIVKQDMREFRRDNSFDLALNLFTSFGYFDDPADDRRVLENILASLKPGGSLLMELVGREWTVKYYQKRDWIELDGAFLCEERIFVDDMSRLHNRLIVLRDGNRREWEFNLRVYSGKELKDLLQQVGFSEVTVYGSLQGAPYDIAATRLIIVATK